jgi:type IV secretory pathway TrbL component
MKNFSSVRAVYLLMSLVLLTGLLLENWYVILFVVVMLQVGVWTKFCPSKWLFEKLGFRKSEL